MQQYPSSMPVSSVVLGQTERVWKRTLASQPGPGVFYGSAPAQLLLPRHHSLLHKQSSVGPLVHRLFSSP